MGDWTTAGWALEYWDQENMGRVVRVLRDGRVLTVAQYLVPSLHEENGVNKVASIKAYFNAFLKPINLLITLKTLTTITSLSLKTPYNLYALLLSATVIATN